MALGAIAEQNEGGIFVVKDATGFPLAYIYAPTQEALRDRYLSPGEALKIASGIVKLPDLLIKQ
jgi:hypothetical protein